jgi:hypothetical protein
LSFFTTNANLHIVDNLAIRDLSIPNLYRVGNPTNPNFRMQDNPNVSIPRKDKILV